MELSKTKSSFYRRLYIAYLIENGIDSVSKIIAFSGMPRRTAQDSIKSLIELDIICQFTQTKGARHQTGHYTIEQWGAINSEWLILNIEQIKVALDYP